MLLDRLAGLGDVAPGNGQPSVEKVGVVALHEGGIKADGVANVAVVEEEAGEVVPVGLENMNIVGAIVGEPKGGVGVIIGRFAASNGVGGGG